MALLRGQPEHLMLARPFGRRVGEADDSTEAQKKAA